jgi:uncharacterized protein YutE (UPF0331/DUF86 family)
LKEQVVQKLGKVREHLAMVGRLQPECDEKFLRDPVYRGALLYYLYVMADTCIALAQAVIRHKGLRPPQSYHEAFDILGDAGVLEPEFAYAFAEIAGFRNFLAHDYEKVEARIICKEVLGKLGEVEEFLRQIDSALS